MSAKKLDDATEAGTIAKVDKSLSKAIMQARTAKKLSQKDLATAINEKATTIQQYDRRSSTPTAPCGTTTPSCVRATSTPPSRGRVATTPA